MKIMSLISLGVGAMCATSSMAQTLYDSQFTWTEASSKTVNTITGQVPLGSVVGGYNGVLSKVKDDRLYVCRGKIKASVHPGKLWMKWCHIGWGGKEVLVDKYEVMTRRPGKMKLNWVSGQNEGMIQGGYNDMSEGFGGYPLYICRAPKRDGLHPGKLWKGMCHIGWGGKEYPVKVYETFILNAPISK